ncbi:hypothetical protein [Gulbenkiania mobilis]|uniref:Uncharacterized protein n=1 Tax=Gulbenkiania mobilis TaxID=397457 RepID=A0ABY2D0E1_GULMO|nr:hypothetical protein EV669_101301 [Gulbenkiania mobilis]
MNDAGTAAAAYLRLIERQGAEPAVVLVRRQWLRRLTPLLTQLPKEGGAYRQAVDAFLERIPLADRAAALTCAREFYYFWLGDVQRLAAMASSGSFSLRQVDLRMAQSLDGLLERMGQEGFGRFPPALDLYLGQLFESGTDTMVLAGYERWLKALLYLLDGQPHRPDSYRAAVDALLLHLPDQGERHRFVELARAFYPSWLAFPSAQDRRGSSAA